MTPAEYKAARQRMGTQPQVAALLGIHRVTIAKREAGDLEISREAVLAIERLLKLPKTPAPSPIAANEPRYPETEDEAIAYAEAMTIHVGVKHIPIELAPGNPFGIKYAAVTEYEAPEYTERGCFALPKPPPE